MSTPEQSQQIRTQFTRESIVEDYRVAFRSRQASLIGRREVLTGKAKFGIFGDGKEIAQLYAHPDTAHDPWSAGRSMNAHFASRLLNDDGSWKPQTENYNTSADVS